MSRWGATVLVLAACGHKDDAPPPKPVAAPPVAADAALPVSPRPIAGTWAHVEPTSPCGFKVLPAPEADRARLVETARARLGRFAGIATIEPTKLNARVERVQWTHAKPPPNAPNAEAARELALELWRTDGDVFGLEHSDLDRLQTMVSVVTGVPGIAWEIHGQLQRASRVDGDIANIGQGSVLVDLDRLGRIVTAKVDERILPPLTVCGATLERAAVERAVAGTSLEWSSSEGHRVEGTADIANITSIERTVMEPFGRTFDPEAPLELALVYVVTVGLAKNRGETWLLQVDPITAKVIGSQPNFMD